MDSEILSRKNLLVYFCFAAAVLAHLLLITPSTVYIANTTNFSVGILSSTPYFLPFGLCWTALFILGYATSRHVLGYVLMAWMGWTAIYLLVGYQFQLFVGDALFDGRTVTYDPRTMTIEASLYLAGLLLMMMLGQRPRRVLLAAATVFVAGNFITLIAPAWPHLVVAQAEGARKIDEPHKYFFQTTPAALPAMDDYSRDKNVVIILVDTLQNDLAEHLLRSSPALAKQFEGFTAFTDVAGGYPFTTLTVPLIFSGLHYPAGGLVTDHLRRSNDLRMDRVLAGSGWETSYLSLLDRGVYIDRVLEGEKNTSLLSKLALYRLLPTAIKHLVFDENENFTEGATRDTERRAADFGFDSNTDVAILRKLTQSMSANSDKPQFKWIHLWGAHLPSNLDAECRAADLVYNSVTSYNEQATCILSLIGAYLARMRTEDIFDNTMIFVMGDHGTMQFPIADSDVSPQTLIQASAHPAILFKDYGATGDLKYSRVPVSLDEIRSTVLSEGPRNLITATHENRSPRQFTYYPLAGMTAEPSIPELNVYTIDGDVRDLEAWQVKESIR